MTPGQQPTPPGQPPAPLTGAQKKVLAEAMRAWLTHQGADVDAIRRLRTLDAPTFAATIGPHVAAVKGKAQAQIAANAAARAAQDAQLAREVEDCDAVLAALAAGEIS